MLKPRKFLMFLIIFYVFTITLYSQVYNTTSYYVAYDKNDVTKYVLVMPSVKKIYTHEAGKIKAKDLKLVSDQFKSFPTYNDGNLCFSELKEEASGDYGTLDMAENCYNVRFFYIQKEFISEGSSFMLYYRPIDKVYEGIGGDAKSFKIVKIGEDIYNENSVSKANYNNFEFDIKTGAVTGVTELENSDSDNDGLADKYEKEFGLIVGERDADNQALDPIYKYQWYLQNLGYAPSVSMNILKLHEDINIAPVWKETLGSPNIVVAVVDTGIESAHEDLTVDLNRSWCYGNSSNDPSVTDAQLYEDKEGSAHGSACAGIIAANGWNGKGTRGIAPKVALAGLNVFSDPTDATFADALQRMNVDVSSNSWGGGGAYWLFDDSSSLQAIENGITNGRKGKGIVYVFASGNDTANANFQSILTSGYVVAVSAVDGAGKITEYSDFGSNILVSAPGGDDGEKKPAIVTTDLSGLDNGMDRYQQHWNIAGNEEGSYTHLMNGTSSACPMVSGVASLILSKNPELTYRDVQYILATTARQVDSSDPSWMTNAVEYPVSNKYGYGVIDADAAVKKAKDFTSLGKELTVTMSFNKSKHIKSGNSITIPFQVNTSFKVLLAKITAWIEHDKRGKLKIELESPSGTKSILAYGDTILNDEYNPWTFASVQMIDESSNGTWKLHITDMSIGGSGELKQFQLVIKGYKK